MITQSEIDALLPRLVEARRDLHRHPELGFEEHRTQSVVRAWLESFGLVPRACAKTGLVADLALRAGDGSTIALRADMDCLPIHEDMEIPHRSVNPGRSHKCGHDGHTAILMGVAALLAEHKDHAGGNIRFLFQPAEEGGGGGRVMVEEGAMAGVREVYGLHSWPGWPKGQVRVCSGPMLAHVTNFRVVVEGVGGHGSQPQLCRDPIVAGAHLVSALQTAVSRGLGYQGGAVLSVCTFHAGTADNIIPPKAELTGTVRTFEEPVRARVVERMREIGRGVAAAFGVGVEVDVTESYPVTRNDTECAEVVRRAAERVVGAHNISSDELPVAGGEDFAYLANAAKGAYFFLGAKKPGETTPVCHHPRFDFDDDLIEVGVKMFLEIVRRRLP
jgi:amidohydrolase